MSDPQPTIPEITCAEFDALLQEELEKVQARIDAYDERVALQAVDNDGKTTDQRAYEALQRDERFPGEHAVASAWLRDHARAVWSVIE